MDERKSFRRCCHVTSSPPALCPLSGGGDPFIFRGGSLLNEIFTVSLEEGEEGEKKICCTGSTGGFVLPRNLQQATTSPPPCPPSPTL